MLTAILVAAVALVVVGGIAWPFLNGRAERSLAESAPNAPDPELQDEIDRALRAIREIEFDHAAGNLDDADFAQLVAAERARAAELLRRRDGVRG
jgi:hypothetical protein